MPLDPQVRQLLDQLEAVGGPTITEQTPEEARALMKALATLEGEPEPVSNVHEATAAGPGGDIPVRVYRPEGEAPLPLLLWYHGGGFVIGDLDTADRNARRLANRAGAVVVSVDYRLAPEHRFPAAVDDSWAALEWARAHAADLGADPERVAVGGDSAGGNLAAVVALLARDRGVELRYQLLVYPVTDQLMSFPSYAENAEGYLLTRDSMVWFISHYLGDGGDAKDVLASPLYADDLQGVAPALVITAEFDPLRDEGNAYAERLREAGVPVTLDQCGGMIHGFFGLGVMIDAANAVVDRAGAALRDALA
jgi:acetyl esterase